MITVNDLIGTWRMALHDGKYAEYVFHENGSMKYCSYENGTIRTDQINRFWKIKLDANSCFITINENEDLKVLKHDKWTLTVQTRSGLIKELINDEKRLNG